MSGQAAFDPRRRYNVIGDFDGLHVVPTYRVIRRGETLLCSAGLADCARFVAAYLAETGEGPCFRPSPG